MNRTIPLATRAVADAYTSARRQVTVIARTVGAADPAVQAGVTRAVDEWKSGRRAGIDALAEQYGLSPPSARMTVTLTTLRQWAADIAEEVEERGATDSLRQMSAALIRALTTTQTHGTLPEVEGTNR